MKGITEDHESIIKDYKSLFLQYEDNVKKSSHYISGHTFQFPSIDHESHAFMI